MIVYKNNTGVYIQKLETTPKDMLHVEATIEGFNLRMTIAYFTVSDEDRTTKRKNEIENILERNTDPLIVAGDFNGHVGFFGEHRLNKTEN